MIIVMEHYPLKRLAALSYVIYTLTAILVISGFCYHIYSNELERTNYQIDSLAYKIESQMDNYLNYIESTMISIASSISINYSVTDVEILLKTLHEKHATNTFVELDNIMFINPHNEGLIDSTLGILTEPIDYSEDINFLMRNTYNVNKVNVRSKIRDSKMRLQQSISFSIGIHNADSKYLGAILYDLPISNVFRYIKSLIKEKSVDFLLTDYYGKNILHYPLHKQSTPKESCRSFSLFSSYNLLLCYEDGFFVLQLIKALLPNILLLSALMVIFIICITYHRKIIINPIIQLANAKPIDKSNVVTEINKISDYINQYNNIGVTLERNNKELIRKDVQVDLANKTKIEFISCISHELRTPLNAIINFSAMMRKEEFGSVINQQYIEYSKDIYDSGTKLLLVVDSILYVTKADAGMIDLRREEVDIVTIIETVINNYKNEIEEKQLTINTEYSDELPKVSSDRKKILLVLSHIIYNSIKFNNQGGTINITVSYTQDQLQFPLVISIMDSGIGICVRRIKYVFNDFNQANSTLKRQFQGMGLGLSIARKIIELYGGEISIESTVEKWTKVTIKLPQATIIRDQ